MVKFSSSGEVLWAKSIENSQCTAVDVVVDSDDNVLLMGVYYYAIEIDGVSLSGSVGSGASGDRVYIAKFNSDGDLQFAEKIEASSVHSTGGAPGYGMSVDNQGDFYVVGDASKSFEIDGVTYSGDDVDDDISFVVKFNSMGNVVWVQLIQPTGFGDVITSDITVNSEGVFVAGQLSGANIDLGEQSYENPFSGLTAFVAKFDLNGNPQWMNTFKENSSAKYCSIVSDSQNNVYALGWKIISGEAAPYSHLISKIHSSGVTLYTKIIDSADTNLGSTQYLYGSKIGGLVTHDNSLYYSGGFNGNFQLGDINYSSINKNISILKLNEIGYPQWIKSIEGTNDDRSTVISVFNDELLFAGIYTSLSLDIDGNTINNNSGNSNSDIFVTIGMDTTSNSCPQITYPIQFQEVEFCSNDSVQLAVYSEYAISLHWHRNGQSFNEGFQDSIFVYEPGIYYAIINENTSCEAYSDTIYIDALADVSSNTNIEVIPSPDFSLGNDTIACQQITLSTEVSAVTYQWSTGSTELEILVQNSGEYWFTATNNFNCTNSDTIEITVVSNPIVNIGTDFLMGSSESEILDAGSFSTGDNYLWENGTTERFREIYAGNMENGSNTYSVDVVDENGCLGTDSIDVCLCSAISGFVFYDFNENGGEC